jgi:hypothetical protein
MIVKAYKFLYYIVLGGLLAYLIYLVVGLYALTVDHGELIVFPIFFTVVVVFIIARILFIPCIMEVRLKDGDVSFLVHRYGLGYWTDPAPLDQYVYSLKDSGGKKSTIVRKLYRFYLDDRYVGLLFSWHWVYIGTGLADFLEMVKSYCAKKQD